MRLKTLLASTALAATLAFGPLASPAVLAQDQIDGATLADEEGKIDAFITAALAVNDVRQAYIERLENVTEESDQVELLQEADAAMLQTVEEAPGISLEEYIAIADAAAADPDLAARIDARFVEAHGQD